MIRQNTTGGFTIVCMVISLILIVCGCSGSNYRPPTNNPVTLGVVPFAIEKTDMNPSALNAQLWEEFGSSGSFRLVTIGDVATILDLDDVEKMIPAIQTTNASLDNISSDSLTLPDSSQQHQPAVQGSDLPRWILTGVLQTERQFIKRGTLIPYVLYAPVSGVQIELEFRLFDRESGRWIEIRQLTEEAGRRGSKQFLEFEENDPSLLLPGETREELRNAAYRGVFSQLIMQLEQLTGVER